MDFIQQVKPMSYQEQVIEIKKLTKSIVKKSKRFAKKTKFKHFQDLARVIDLLSESNKSL